MSLADILNGLSDIVNPPTDRPPKPLPSIGVDALLPKEWADQLATVVPRTLASVASFPTDAYGLAGSGINYLKGDQNDPNGSVQGALDISKSIHAPVEKMAESFTGKPFNDSLIHGTPAELAATWGTLGLGGVMKAPGIITDALTTGINTLKSGTTLAEKAGGAGLQALSYVSPVMLHDVGAAGAAVNTAVPGALGVGLETLFPKPDSVTAGIAKGTDTAMAGANDVHEVHKAVDPVAASFSTGNTALDISLAAVLGVTALATMKRDIFNRVLGGMGQTEKTTLGAPETLTTQLADRMMPIKSTMETALTDAGVPNATERAAGFSNRADASYGSAISTKTRSAYDEGQIPGSAVKMPSTNDFYTKLKTVDQPTQDAVEKALNQPRSAWANLQGQQAELVRDADSITRKLLDYVVEQKQITPSNAAALRLMNTHEILQSLSGDGNIVQSARRAGADLPGNILQDLPQRMEQVIRNTEAGKIRTEYISTMRALEDSGQKGIGDILGVRDGVAGSHNEDTVLKYLDHNGLPRTQEFKDALVFNSLKDGASIARLHSVGGAMLGIPKLVRFGEQASTGGIAAALGQPFAHIGALYNALFGSPLREPGTYGGYVDKALQRAGFKFGLPGDPSGLASLPYHAATGVLAVMAKRTAQVLHNHVVKEAFAKGTMSPSAANDAATWLSNQYKKNWIYHFQQRGMLGPNAIEQPSADEAIKVAQSRMMRNGVLSVPVNVAGDTYRFINEIAHTIGASPGAMVYNLNKSRGEELASRAVRQWSGDTGRSGAFRGNIGAGLAGATRITPYGNTMIQAAHKFAQAWGKNPVSAAVGTATTVGSAVIGSALWNLKLGPQYTKYEYLQRNPDQQASSFYIGLPGLPPEQGLEIPVDPMMRPHKLAMHMLTGWKLGLFDGSIHKPENEDIKRSFAEQATSRWALGGKGSVGESAMQQTIVPPVSPLFGVPLALAGVQLRNYGDATEIHRNKTAGYTSSDAANPNRSLFGLHESANAEQIVRSLGSNSLTMAYNAVMEGAQRVNEGRELMDAAMNARRLETLGTSDRFRSVSGLLGSFNTVSPSQDAASTLVSQKIKGMQGLIQAFEANTSNGALLNGNIGNKQRGFQQLMGGQITAAPNDPRMLELSYYAKLYMKQIEQQVLGPNNDLYNQMNSIRAGTDRSPERKRATLNNVGQQIVKNNQQGLQMLQQFESAMSNTFKTPIKLDKFNPDEGVTGQGGQ